MIFLSNARKRKNKKSSFRWMQFLLMFILVGGLIFILFPQKLFLSHLLDNTETSEISLNYLTNLVNNDPKNLDLKFTLASEELKVGHVDVARRVITPLVSFAPQKPIEWQALWLYYQIVRVETFKLPEYSPQRLNKENGLRQLMSILINSPVLTYKQKVELANNEVLAGDPERAYKLYEKILSENQHVPTALYAKAAGLALSIKQYNQSANYYHKAMLQSNDLEKKRLYFSKALQALEFSGQPLDALNFAEGNIDGLSDDKDTLMLMVNVALNAGSPQIAEKYMDKLMQINIKD